MKSIEGWMSIIAISTIVIALLLTLGVVITHIAKYGLFAGGAVISIIIGLLCVCGMLYVSVREMYW